MAITGNEDVYNPEENTNDEKLPKRIEEILKDEEELETPELAEKIGETGLFTKKTVRPKLYYAIPDVRDRTDVVVEKEKGDSGGDDTWKWKVIE